MVIHTTVGVEKANVKLDVVVVQTEELSEKCASSLYIHSMVVLTVYIRMKTMIRLFQDLITPPEKKLTARVDEMGGKAVVLGDEQALETLAEEEFILVEPDPESRRDSVPKSPAELRQEIEADPNKAIQKNAESFNRKFEIQRKRIVEEITLALSQQTSRIISATEAGPHDRVVDQVWREVSDLCMNPYLTYCP